MRDVETARCPCCQPYLAPAVAHNGWSKSTRPEGNPVLALTRVRGQMTGGWLRNTYRLRLPTGHVCVAEPHAAWLGIDDLHAELDSLAEFGWSYVISQEQALHWTGDTVSVQLYPKGVRPLDLKKFWRTAIRHESRK